ncbi:hypothetical protein OKA05_27300 [Luteolibacter arcticus]|uniref:Bacterial toxin 44 domain-containing protein n=1 Tax=Luteolibacter arcticus TaxID=1581411 RepID=A0ABT3GS30_9BACT|nr:hypothetical protein [Luteolibacter arcticus]MCW1926291.1 hypothetical protein [Luteolibacter arcticus]
MKFEIHHHEGAGPVRFGMTTTEVRKALGSKFKNGTRGSSPQHPYDYFKEYGCFVYYNMDGKMDAIEFGERGQPTLGGENLLGLSFKDLFKRIKKLDAGLKWDGTGFISKKLGVGSYAPMGDSEPKKPAEGFIVFRKGYYDK